MGGLTASITGGEVTVEVSSTGGASVGRCASGSGGGRATVTERDGTVDGTGRDRTAKGAESDDGVSAGREVFVVLAGGVSVRRVTVPGSEKSRSSPGPIESGAGAGAGVTALVVAGWAASGGAARLPSASATPHFAIVTPRIRIDCLILLICPGIWRAGAERAMNGALMPAKSPRFKSLGA